VQSTCAIRASVYHSADVGKVSLGDPLVSQMSTRRAQALVPIDAALDPAKFFSVASSSGVGLGMSKCRSRLIIARTVLRTALSINCSVSFIPTSLNFSWEGHYALQIVKGLLTHAHVALWNILLVWTEATSGLHCEQGEGVARAV
jgi:hypothetical protein